MSAILQSNTCLAPLYHFGQNGAMACVFFDLFTSHLQKKGANLHAYARDRGLEESTFYSIRKRKFDASDDLIRTLAADPWLGLTAQQMLAWRAIDQYGSDVIEEAGKVLKQIKKDGRKVIKDFPARARAHRGRRKTVIAEAGTWLGDNLPE